MRRKTSPLSCAPMARSSLVMRKRWERMVSVSSSSSVRFNSRCKAPSSSRGQPVCSGDVTGSSRSPRVQAACWLIGRNLPTSPTISSMEDAPMAARNSRTSLASAVREFLAAMGASSIDEIVGEVGRLRPINQQAACTLGDLLDPVTSPEQTGCPRELEGALHLELNRTLEELDTLTIRSHRFRITNEDRAIGAQLSGEVLRRMGRSQMIAPLDYKFVGIAGQSFGAFLSSGISLRLEGEANDYVGKGLSGGRISITAGAESSQRGDVLAGNTVL